MAEAAKAQDSRAIERLTQERLQHLLHYDPETGLWTWRVSMPPRGKPGAQAGYWRSDGYLVIGIHGEHYLGHVLAWFYMTGGWSEKDVDHRDTVRSNNRWANLRGATRQQTTQNARMRNPRSQLKGAYGGKRGRWYSRIGKDGKMINLGSYRTKEEAHAAYRNAAVKLFGEFARW